MIDLYQNLYNWKIDMFCVMAEGLVEYWFFVAWGLVLFQILAWTLDVGRDVFIFLVVLFGLILPGSNLFMC